MGREGFDNPRKEESEPVNAACYVQRASLWAQRLEDMEAARAGSRPAARDALERRHKLPSGSLYSLRYRPPKRLAVDLYEKLRAALIAAAEREQQALAHEIEIARRAGVAVDHPALVAAEAAARDETESR